MVIPASITSPTMRSWAAGALYRAFHTDHSNHPRPPKATTLFAVNLPSSGDTQYINMHDAFDDLPADTKQRIDGLKAVHVYLSKYSPRPLGKISEESRRNLPPPGIHPLCARIPKTAGRRCSSTRCAWLGMEDKEALALIDDLMLHATRKKYEYRHRWRPGDWVLWDNRSVMHQANPDYDMNERRYLYRLMLAPVWSGRDMLSLSLSAHDLEPTWGS